VDFLLSLPDGTVQDMASETVDGVASAQGTVVRSGSVGLTVKSGDLASSAEPLMVQNVANGGSGSSNLVLPLILSTSLAGAAALGVGGVVLVRRRRRVAVAAPSEAVLATSATGSLPVLVAEPSEEQELYINTITQQVVVRGKEIMPPLSREQYSLLAFLFENAGKVCLRDDIISRAWPEALGGVSDEAVDALVHRVRDRLRAAGASKLYIVTIRGRGFRLDL
jgi:hypothetical protein